MINKILKLFSKNKDENEDKVEFTHVDLGTLLISKTGKIIGWGKDEEHVEEFEKEKEGVKEYISFGDGKPIWAGWSDKKEGACE